MHLAVSVVRIAAESCEAAALIKTTDHFLQDRERKEGCNVKQNYSLVLSGVTLTVVVVQ